MYLSAKRVFAIVGGAVLSVAACGDDDGATGGGGPSGQQDAGNVPSASSDGGDRDAGTNGDAARASLGSGPFTLAYAGTTVGIDGRAIAQGKATFDGAKMTGYEASDDERPQLGTNQVSDVSGDEFVALGRWSGGATTGKFYEVNSTGLIDLPANGGFHYVIGNFTAPMPASGSSSYSELAKTVATVSDGSIAPGTISGSLAVNFAGASTKIGFSVVLDVPGDVTYTLATTGGAADVSASEAELGTGNVKGAFYANLQINSAGAACGGTCSGAVQGFVAGPGAERVALVAHVYSGSGGSPKSVTGAIVFKR
jgi:hypothetical protein